MSRSRALRSLIGALAGAAALVGVVPAAAGAQTGGPVILGGDDLTAHGGVDPGTGASEGGWLYMERAVARIRAGVVRPNDNTIAAFGSADPGVPGPPGDAGAAIRNAATKNGMGVVYFDGPAAIAAGMAQIRTGAYSPAIVWIAGDEGANDLGSDGPCSDTNASTTFEGEAVNFNAGVINGFVNQGGGLLSHGTCYLWLFGFRPGLGMFNVGGLGDLYLTPIGSATLPGLPGAALNAGGWHGHFRGNFGGLQALVRSSTVDDEHGQDAAVIIGGDRVTIGDPPVSAPAPAVAAAPPPAPAAPAPDRTAPRIALAGVPARARCRRAPFTARVTVTEPRLRRVDVFVGGRRVRRTTTHRFAVRVSLRGLRPGRRHTVRVVALDAAGNRATRSRSFVRCRARVSPASPRR